MSHKCEQKDGSEQRRKEAHTDQMRQQELLTKAREQDPLADMSLYDFEKVTPPMLTERMLRHKLEEEQARKQALLVTVAAVATQLLLLVSMVLLYEYMPGLALVGMGYVMISLAAGLITAAVYVERRTTG